MIVRYWRAAVQADDESDETDSIHVDRRLSMKWETPEAIDMRFGMEITMYISNR